MNNRVIDDAEDMIEEKKPIRKIRKESSKFKEENPETQEILEYALNDFREFESLRKYKNLKFLTLNNQNIQSIEIISKSLSCLHLIEFLCLNDNQINSLSHIDTFKNLKELSINFNHLSKIENINNLENLEKVWFCENKIEKIENLPKNIKNLWIASNCINALDESIIEYDKLEEINIANNLIIEFEDVDKLSKLNKLRTLYFSDPNFGENPLCFLSNYRVFVINMLPNLEILDSIKVTSEERKDSSSIYSKKSLFYIIKIKSLNRLCKNILTSLKSYLLFFLMFKTLQINFFNKRIKMLEYIEFDRNNVIKNPETSEEERNFKSEELKEILKEKASSLEKLNKCLKNYDSMNENFKSIKDYIGEINDFMIVNTFYELETGGNIRLEPGTIDEKWANNCLELIRSRISQTFFSKNNLKSMNILKIFKIFNKKQKILYESIYDSLLEKHGKFSEENKCYENTFLYLHTNDLEKILKIILNCYEGYEVNTLIIKGDIVVSNYLDKIEEIKLLQNNQKKRYLIVCKWIFLESAIETSETYTEETPLNKIVSCFTEGNKTNSNNLSYYKVCNSDRNKKVIIVKNKYICLPEFLVEYSYTFQNFNITNSSNDNFIISPYTSKNDFKTETFQAIDSCLKKLGESNINKFIDYNLIEKYKNIKSFSIEELNTTSSLFFAKATIIKFMQKCFKYSNIEDFSSEYNKINDKIEEINSLNFSNLMIKDLDENKHSFEKLKSVNLFNSQLKDKDLTLILDKLLMIEELSLSNNFLELFNFKDINNTLKKIDLSHNRISCISNFNPKLFTLLEYVDIDFNHIFSLDHIKEFFKVANLKKFSFYFNPLPCSILKKIKECDRDEEKLKILFNKEEKHSILEEIHKIDLENETIKNVDIIYNSYSFTNRYALYTKNPIFREKCIVII